MNSSWFNWKCMSSKSNLFHTVLQESFQTIDFSTTVQTLLMWAKKPNDSDPPRQCLHLSFSFTYSKNINSFKSNNTVSICFHLPLEYNHYFNVFTQFLSYNCFNQYNFQIMSFIGLCFPAKWQVFLLQTRDWLVREGQGYQTLGL